jgi:hypothetical protein
MDLPRVKISTNCRRRLAYGFGPELTSWIVSFGDLVAGATRIQTIEKNIAIIVEALFQ